MIMKLASLLLPVALSSVSVTSANAYASEQTSWARALEKRRNIDVSKYSLKVHSCASITGLDPDEIASLAEGDGKSSGSGDDYDEKWTNKTTTIINYRLCPSDYCQDDSWEGCYGNDDDGSDNSNEEGNTYGTFMITAQQFLESKQSYRENEEEELCQKCKWCSWMYSKFSVKCDFYDQCQTSCKGGDNKRGGNDKDNDAIDLQDYLECTAVDVYEEETDDTADDESNGDRRNLHSSDSNDSTGKVYLQVYCDGGTSLKLGIYSDEDCLSYIGDDYDVAEVTGLNVTESAVSDLNDEMKSSCLSCDTSASSSYYILEYDGNEADGTKRNDNRDNNNDEASNICQNVYEQSLECNEYAPILDSNYNENVTSCGLRFTAYPDPGEYLFDMSQYSLKIHSCASIPGINPDELDSLAEGNGSYVDSSDSGSGSGSGDSRDDEWTNKTTTVINYRLCPTDSCQDNGWDGCYDTYGSYMVTVKQFLESKQESQNNSNNNKNNNNKDRGGGGEQGQIEYHEFAECTAVDIYVPEDQEEEESAEGETDGEGSDYGYDGNRRRLTRTLGWWGSDDDYTSSTIYDDNKVYLQVYCDGGTTLKLGIFSDEDCMNYIGDQFDISTVTGLNVTESDLEDELTSDCVSCSETRNKYYYYGDDNDNGSNSNDSDDDITDTCKALYEDSLKCNVYLPFNTTMYYKEAEDWEENVDNSTCTFLEAMQEGESVTKTSNKQKRKYVYSSNSYSMSSSSSSFSYTDISGGGSFYAVGAALAVVGAAIVVVKRTRNTYHSKTIGEKDMNDAFVYKGGDVA